MDKKKVVTRIAPSPTGLLHIGTARSALFNYLYAKKHGGEFVVRIEDTDKTRSKKEFEDDIVTGFEWLGLSYDTFVRQSERVELYIEKLNYLIEKNVAYVSKEKAKDNPTKEVAVVRLRNPGKTVVFTDMIRGEISFDTTELGDFVIARSVTDPLYHFAVVVDDADMGVTDVIRGEDHISNTPRQILIQEALGIERPLYAHVPLILVSDRSKMSKRKGAVSVNEYKAMGFLPEAIINYLALLGWNPGTEKEVYTMDDLIKDFSIENIHKGGAIFDIEKLKWIQKEHIKRLPREAVVSMFGVALKEYDGVQKAFVRSKKAFDDTLERFALTSDFEKALREGEFDFYEKRPLVTKESLSWKKETSPETIPDRLQKVSELLTNVEEVSFMCDTIKDAVWDFAEREGKGAVLWPMRVALSGKERSPDPFILAEALGKTETLARLEHARKLYT